MLVNFLSVLLFLLLIILSLIHFNWFIGGKFGLKASLPTNENGEKVLKPTKMDSAIVGAGLLLFSLFYLSKIDLVGFQFPTWITTLGNIIIPLIFILRAIGDFKYVGFFKKIKTTYFAKMDSKLFSPLCLTIGMIGLLIYFLN